MGLRCPGMGSGPRCTFAGKNGTCQVQSSCKTRYGDGICPGSPLIKCCLGKYRMFSRDSLSSYSVWCFPLDTWKKKLVILPSLSMFGWAKIAWQAFKNWQIKRRLSSLPILKYLIFLIFESLSYGHYQTKHPKFSKLTHFDVDFLVMDSFLIRLAFHIRFQSLFFFLFCCLQTGRKVGR